MRRSRNIHYRLMMHVHTHGTACRVELGEKSDVLIIRLKDKIADSQFTWLSWIFAAINVDILLGLHSNTVSLYCNETVLNKVLILIFIYIKTWILQQLMLAIQNGSYGSISTKIFFFFLVLLYFMNFYSYREK